MSPKKRVKIVLKNPNPLFEKWLIEWRDEAKSKNSKMQYCFIAALKSLEKYPLPLETGKQCKILNGFGDKLCAMLDEKLTKHRNSGDAVKIDSDIVNVTKTEVVQIKPKNQTEIPKGKEKETSYSPKYRSGGYAILISMYKSSNTNQLLTKEQIVEEARFFTDVSFTKPEEPATFYTAWSSMATLICKNLVRKEGKPAKFSLTEQGVLLAENLYFDSLQTDQEDFKENREGNIDVSNLINDKIIDVSDEENEAPKKRIKLPENSIIFEPNSFEVILLVDTAETSGTHQAHEDPIIADLLRIGTNFEIRHLKVGDYLWICRHKQTKSELLLPYIVERKRTDDFGQSIKDGRYHKQKFRLNQCGVRNVIYLIESYGKNTQTGLPMSTLMQAATNTLVQDGFQVKFCESSRSTAYYLNTMSRILIRNYSNKIIESYPEKELEKVNFNFHSDVIPTLSFSEFTDLASQHKKFTVKEIFIKQLLQLKGLSVDKALAIVEKYPTPRLLTNAYKYSDSPEKLLSGIVFGKGKRTVGPVISKIIYELYSIDF